MATPLHSPSAKPLFFCLILLFCQTLLPQSAWASPPLQVNDTSFRHSLMPYLDFLDDPTGKLQVADLLSEEYQYQFTPAQLERLHFGFNQSVYWLRFYATRTPNVDLNEFLLQLKPPSLDKIDLYVIDGNNQVIQVSRSGSERPYLDRDIPFATHLFQLPISSQTYTYLLRIESQATINLTLEAIAPARFIADSAEQEQLTGIIFGALAVIALIQFAMGFLFRSSIFFFQGSYMLTAIGMLLCWLGILYRFFPNTVGLQEYLLLFFISITSGFCTLFTRAFLKTDQSFPAWHKLLTLLAILSFACSLLIFALPLDTAALLITNFSLIAVLGLLFIAIYGTFVGNAQSQMYLIARLPTLLILLVTLMSILGYLHQHDLAQWGLLVGLCYEGVFFILTLTHQEFFQWRGELEKRQLMAINDIVVKSQQEALAKTTHDFRTPMTGIMGMTELLLDTTLTHSQREYLLTIKESAEKLINMVNKVVDLSTLRLGQQQIEPVAFDVSAVISDCLDQFQQESENRRIELICDLDNRLPTHIIGDPGLLRQAIINIIGNSFQRIDKGEILLSVYPKPGIDNGSIEFAITDTATPLGDAYIKQLLQSQSVNELSLQDNSSTHVNLAITRNLLNLMGAELKASSNSYGGNRFWFSLPMQEQEPQLQQNKNQEGMLRDKRLLVVDDNETCRKVIQQQATQWGMQVQTAENGAEALAMMRNQANLKEHFDAIILDHDMPNMNGLQLAARIKEEPMLHNDMLMIMLTGLNIAPSSQMARNAGVRRVLTKPVRSESLKRTLSEEISYLQSLSNTDNKADAERYSNLNILIAEDNPVSAKVIKGMLNKLEIQSTTVKSGDQVLEEVKRHRFDMVLMDCDMPVMDGFEATEHIRIWEQQNERAQLPIIALTAHVPEKKLQKNIANGMSGYLIKPVELSQLKDTIQQWCLNDNQP